MQSRRLSAIADTEPRFNRIRKQIKHRSENRRCKAAAAICREKGPGNIMMGMSCSITAQQKQAAIGIQHLLLHAPGRRRRKTTQQQKNKREYIKKKKSYKNDGAFRRHGSDTAASETDCLSMPTSFIFLPQKSRF